AAAPQGPSRHARILFSGTAWRAAMDAQNVLAEHHDVAAECWSATSYKCLRDDALETERWNRLHPSDAPRVPFVAQTLNGLGGPTIAVTDFIKAVPDQIARWVQGPYLSLGTDGYGRSDTREALRRHFEVDAGHLVVATLSALALMGEAKSEE